MKIILAEVREQQATGERIFEKPIVKVGRDQSACDIVFPQTEWPMVSRRHAEFRLRDGQCFVMDTDSKFGTYLNGQRIAQPQPVAPGAHVQFGTNGPVLRVVHVEAQIAPPVPLAGGLMTNPDAAGYATTPDIPAEFQSPQYARNLPPESAPPLAAQPIAPPLAAPPASQPLRASGYAPAPPASAPLNQSRPASAPVALEYTDAASGQMRRASVEQDVMLLGRDPSSGVPVAADSIAVSRRHAEIHRSNGQFTLVDLGSFNGTLLNGQRITTPTPLFDGDQIQLGFGGPTLRFIAPSHPPVPGARAGDFAGSGLGWQSGSGLAAPAADPAESGQRTMVVRSGSSPAQQPSARRSDSRAQHLMQVQFNGKTELKVGRAPDNDIRLDGLQISNYHARFIQGPNGLQIEDNSSTNGVYINDARISGRRPVQPQDMILIGPFVLRVDPQRGIAVFDTRSKTRIDVIDITKEVPNRSGGGMIRLLDDVDLTIQPNEFVGLLGPSGAGKSTLMDALNGMRPPTAGRVFINNLDFYQHLDSLKQGIGYVPQDDIIHRELTVYRTLYYVARLRLSRDVSKQEIDQIINEVLDVTGLSERRDVPVSQLSGGQRKRVSIAVELITKPSIIFLDEPTSGLDPATEEKIMKLFRQIAESGRTVILTTHAMENVRLFDKIVVLMRGKLVFYGKPQEALDFVQAESFKELYDKLEAPVDAEIAKLQTPAPNASATEKRAFKHRREQIAEQVAEEWRRRFQQTEIYRQNVALPLSGQKHDMPAHAVARRRTSVVDSVRQWGTLTRRYMQVLGRDRLNLLILFAQAPIIALLTYLVVGTNAPRDFPFFMLALVAIWFGTSVSAREIVKERPVYKRERMVNLGLIPYVGSKLFVLSMIVGAQCILLFGTLKLMDIAGLMSLPSYPEWLFGVPQLIVMILTAMVGIALGLLISALVKTSEMATSLVPLILIPQILFSGLVGVPESTSKVIGLTMPATWSFDEMKRLSGLDTLSREGSDPDGENRGEGLYNFIEQENDRIINEYREESEQRINDYERAMETYQRGMREGRPVTPPRVPELPPAPEAKKIPDNLSGYVNFLHPWMHVLVNPIVLLIMFFGLVLMTLITLRLQDTR